MRFSLVSNKFPISLLVTLSAFFVGCGQPAGNGAPQPAASQVSNGAREGQEHGGWWCAEHGVPEEECTLCSTEAAAKFKEKGDWCQEHNRAESQCFKCDPSRADKFAKLHEAKYGTQPPARTE